MVHFTSMPKLLRCTASTRIALCGSEPPETTPHCFPNETGVYIGRWTRNKCSRVVVRPFKVSGWVYNGYEAEIRGVNSCSLTNAQTVHAVKEREPNKRTVKGRKNEG
jgi:hypothetical protein